MPKLPDRFRAYADATAASRRTVDVKGNITTGAGEKKNIEHAVEEPVLEGAVTSGLLSFTTEKPITKIVFYAPEPDPAEDADEEIEVCVGSVDVNRAGAFSYKLSFNDEAELVIEETQV